MKKIIILLIIATIFASCTDSEKVAPNYDNPIFIQLGNVSESGSTFSLQFETIR